jgi:hypothetical protein
MLSHFEAAGLADVVLEPIAPTPEGVATLLGNNKGGAGARAAQKQGDGPSAVQGEEEPAVPDVSAAAGSEKKPSKKELERQAADIAQLVHRSRKAYSMLLNALGIEQRMLVQHIPRGDAHGVWQVLSSRYERKTAASKYYTRTKLHNARMERGEKFDNYLARLKDLAHRLQSMKAPVSDDELLLAMLKGLPPSFESLVASLRLKDDLTLDVAADYCRDHEELRQQTKEVEAHFVKAGGGGRGNKRFGNSHSGGGAGASSLQGGGKPKGNCFLCNQGGHVMFDCTRLPSSAVKCTQCRRVGHTKENCRRGERRVRFEGGANKSPKQASEEEMAAALAREHEDETHSAYSEDDWAALAYEEPAAAAALSAVTTERALGAWSQGPPTWILDTGATRHLSNNKKMLHDLGAIEPVTMRAANNETLVLREGGSARVTCDNGGSLELRDVAYDSSLAANLLSVSHLTDSGATVIFDQKEARIVRNEEVVFTAPRQGNLYRFSHNTNEQTDKAQEQAFVSAASAASVSAAEPEGPQPAPATPAIVLSDPLGVRGVEGPTPANVQLITRLHARLGPRATAHAGAL